MTDAIDLVVLGTGPAGASIATRCAKAGQRVVIVEAREVGGTCALRGCNPKKVLVDAAELVDRVRRAEGKLVRAANVRIDWRELIAFEKTFTEPVPDKSRGKLEKAGVEIIVGRPRFVSPSRIVVDDRTLEPEHVVIATGAKPRPLDIEGAEHVITNDVFLTLSDLPKRLLFVGAGYISFEFAHVALRAGSHVTIWGSDARPLGGFDADHVAALVEVTRGLGADVKASTRVAAVRAEADGTFRVTSESGDEAHVDGVVHGAGRVPSLDGLDLDAAGVDHDKHGVLVDDFMRSPSNPRVLAAGDCVASESPALTPVANAHAHAITENLIAGRDERRPDLVGVAGAVFTIPRLARVGRNISELDDPDVVDVREGDWSRFGSVRKVCADTARYKVLVHRETDEILGAHLLGPAADEVINLFALAMRAGITASQLKAAPLAFPTSGHDIRSMV